MSFFAGKPKEEPDRSRNRRAARVKREHWKKKAGRVLALILVIILVLALIVGFIPIVPSAAAAAVPPGPPQNVRLVQNGFLDSLGNNWFAEIGWNTPVFPTDPTPYSKGLDFYINRVEWGSGDVTEDIMQVPLNPSVTSFLTNEYLPNTLDNGTIYEVYGRSWYTFGDNGMYSSSSQKSIAARFLTDIDVTVELVPGTNTLKIVWDDVWDIGGRISYRILISDTQGFTQPATIPDILSSQIGTADSPVTVNTSAKKLEYLYEDALPGREYAIKVVPLVDTEVNTMSVDTIVPVTIKTDILLKAQKVGATSDGVIWKLFWNPIVKGDVYSTVDYELYRYEGNSTTGRLFALIPDQDYFYVTVLNTDTTAYKFRVDALAYPADGSSAVEFRSTNKVALEETIPEKPEAPELVDAFENADPEPLRSADLQTATSATVLWKVPLDGSGAVDTDVTYDIHLVTSVADTESPPSSSRIASNFTPGTANMVYALGTDTLIGYRYDLSSLESNTTYYFVIQAKKNYLVYDSESGYMVTTPFVSESSVKVIVTSADTGADRPVAPIAPPFALKSEDTVTKTGCTLTMKKKWHQLYDATNRKWEYATEAEYEANELLADGDAAKRASLIVDYSSGWTVKIHVVAFNDAVYVVKTLKNRDYVAYSDLMQAYITNLEVAQTDVKVPVRAADADQSFDLPVTGLTENTAYLVWITVENDSGKESDASDPLSVTTLPTWPDNVLVPAVPDITAALAADTFVDLFWSYSTSLDYEVKYALTDDIGEAISTIAVTGDSLATNSYCRITGLTPSTVYYFWLRAINPDQKTESGGIVASDWSDSVAAKTEALRPPAAPTGFGILADSVTLETIGYEWTSLTGQTYILEFADNSLFEDAVKTPVSGDTYTVTGLESNRRYYARLYAVDTTTTLVSEPTSAIMVVTSRSRTEYDASYDLEDVPTGDVLQYGTIDSAGLWTIASTGVQADRLSEDLRDIRDSVVKIDLTSPPGTARTIRLELGTQVLDSLTALNKELLIRTPFSDVTVRPGSLQTDAWFRARGSDAAAAVRFDVRSPVPERSAPADASLKSPLTSVAVAVGASGNYASLDEFARPLKAGIPVTNLSQYQRNEIAVHLLDLKTGLWSRRESTVDYTSGYVSADLPKPAVVAVGTRKTATASATPSWVTDSLAALQKQYDLKTWSGETFQYAEKANAADLCSLLMDLMRVDWNADTAASMAVHAGFVAASDVSDGTKTVSRQTALAAAVALYRKTSGDATPASNATAWAAYTDLGSVAASKLPAVRFAIETGIVRGDGSGLLSPGAAITNGELVAYMQRALAMAGKLE